MDVLLATPPTTSHRTAEENLGLGYIASSLRAAGLKVAIIDAWLEGLTPGELAEQLERSSPRVFVGFSAYRTNMATAVETLDLLRVRGFTTPAVAGGYGPTFHAEDFIESGFQYVLRGEAEEAAVRLALELRKSAPSLAVIPGLSYKARSGTIRHNAPLAPPELDDLDPPDRDTLRLTLARRSAVHVSTSRGCLAHCLFCSIIAFQRAAGAPRWRHRSLTSVLNELRTLHDAGVRHVKVVDDSFLEPPRDATWCERLADGMHELGLGDMTLRGSIRADRVDLRTALALSRAGFVAFSCGVENFADTALKRMNKSASSAQNLSALAAFAEAGILVQMGMILFDQSTTMNELRTNAAALGLFDNVVTKGVFTEMYAAEGTAFTRHLRNRGLLQESESIATMNSSYKIADGQVRTAYKAMKLWHTAHARLYDKTIDPVSAPKALNRSELWSFMPAIRQLAGRDLRVFRVVIELIDAGVEGRDIEEHIRQMVLDASDESATINASVDALYAQARIEYDGDLNPFL
jgi:anaerobic magnesium-protoporphyrin IX monomethyl ester cyclase